MKPLIGLVSGGKDSCLNLMTCLKNGYKLVCLAHLRPPESVHELDSYMFQSVGQEAVEKVYEAVYGVPLYAATIKGKPIELGKEYKETENDEVEDLYNLLKHVKQDMNLPDDTGVSVGAIASEYQKLRVENVCQRLGGLTPLCYLWRRDQTALLQEMIDSGIDAIVIKVAAMGLEPNVHLGMDLKTLQPELMKKKDTIGLNVCGEGGEFESFVLDCPIFHKRIVLDETEVVIHSQDAFAPVGYLKLNKFHLEDKPGSVVNGEMSDKVMRIYFAGSIRAGRQDAGIYARIVDMLRPYGTVLTEHVAFDQPDKKVPPKLEGEQRDKFIFEQDMDWLKSCDVVVAEATQPSLGVGFELGAAWRMGKKILCLFRPSSGIGLSAMIAGAVGDGQIHVIKYENTSELEEKFQTLLK